MKTLTKTIILTITLISGLMMSSCGLPAALLGYKTKKINVRTDTGAILHIDGRNTGSNMARIKVAKRTTIHVDATKTGFITERRNYTNVRSVVLPKSDYLPLSPDDAFASSVNTDMANRNVEIATAEGRTEEEVWKLVSRVVLDHFDVIEIADATTGYLRTAWSATNFRSASIRTRLIVKYAGDSPLTYRIKLASEIAPSFTSVKADERFDPWDRVLRVYNPIIDDLRSRLAKS